MLMVVGASGDLGGRVVRQLLGHGEQVRCMVRSEARAAELREAGADVAIADLCDPTTLPPACDGVRTIVATATAILRRLTGDRTTSIRAVDHDGMSALVAAAAAAGVERFVYVSYAGIGAMPGMPLERAKSAIEQQLGSSPMQAVVARPDGFQEIHLTPVGRFDPLAGKVAVFGKGDNQRRWVATDDVAALLTAVAREPEPPAVVEFGGPEALSRNEAIAIAEQALGRQIKKQHMPRAAARLGMRLLGGRNDALASVFGTGLLQDLQPASWDDEPLRVRGITPRPAGDFIRALCNEPAQVAR